MLITCIECQKQKSGRFTKGRCRSCYEKNLRAINPEFAERQRNNSREWHQQNPDKARARHWEYHINRTYGISSEEYFNILEAQNGGCKLCGRKPYGKNKLPVDHCHKTGKTRGIICTPCNRALGILEDNLEKVLEYLKPENWLSNQSPSQSA